MLDMCRLSEDSDGPRASKHRELERAKYRKSEDVVPDKNHLNNIASGAPSPPDVKYDVHVLHAEKLKRSKTVLYS